MNKLYIQTIRNFSCLIGVMHFEFLRSVLSTNLLTWHLHFVYSFSQPHCLLLYSPYSLLSLSLSRFIYIYIYIYIYVCVCVCVQVVLCEINSNWLSFCLDMPQGRLNKITKKPWTYLWRFKILAYKPLHQQLHTHTHKYIHIYIFIYLFTDIYKYI